MPNNAHKSDSHIWEDNLDRNRAIGRYYNFLIGHVGPELQSLIPDKGALDNLNLYGSQGERVLRNLSPHSWLYNLPKYDKPSETVADEYHRRIKQDTQVFSNAYDKAKESIGILKDMKDEADPGVWSSLKNTVPSYTLHALPMALIGYHVAPKKYKRVGAFTGIGIGLLANYIRRKLKYGDLIHL